ncbi:hypothetical protein [Azospirillum halopraeferens]|uniref:hypothetical protein n=1 Tax=Azospirillum halopraeferens TaxID=34010 RepID=UPI000422EFB2|nr:hypothetical protein [Azospirillum halopraeferens]
MQETTSPLDARSNLEQSIEKLGDAAKDAAAALGDAARDAAGRATEKVGPAIDAARDAAAEAARNADIAVNTVARGCGDSFGAGWSALMQGNFGTAGQMFGTAMTSCTESFTAALMGLFPGWW